MMFFNFILGLDAEDIINTLVVLNMIRKGKPHETVPVIVVNWSLVESYMIKKKSKLKILPENLLWKPHQITHKVGIVEFIVNFNTNI